MAAKRKSYTAEFKLQLVKYAAENGNRATERRFGVSEKLVRDWRKTEACLIAMKKSKKANRGLKARWPELEQRLHRWVLDQGAAGRHPSTIQLRLHAQLIAAEMNITDFAGGPSWCYRFMHRFMHRKHLPSTAPTTMFQNLPPDFQVQFDSFRVFVKEQVTAHHVLPDHIINMDEVPITFDIPIKQSVAEKGQTGVTTVTAGLEKFHFTVVLGCCGDGSKLPPMVIFKRKTVLKTRFPFAVVVASSEKGWMDEDTMNLWLKKCYSRRSDGFLKTHKALLVMESLPAYITAGIRSKIEACNSIPVIIPEGLTKMLQPLYIAVNQSFEAALRSLWDAWVLDGEQSLTTTERYPTFQQVVGWIDKAWSAVATESILLGFRQAGLTGPEADENQQLFGEWEGPPDQPFIKEEEEEVYIPEYEFDFAANTSLSEEDEKQCESLQFHNQNYKWENSPEGSEPARGSGPNRDLMSAAEDGTVDFCEGYDTQQLTGIKEQSTIEQIDWRTNIKEEEEELCIHQNDADIKAVSVKSEDDEVKPQSSGLNPQNPTDKNSEDCGGPVLCWNFGTDVHLESDTEEETEDSEDDWKESSEPSSLKTFGNNGILSKRPRNTGEELGCPECGKTFACRSYLLRHLKRHTGEKLFSCTECGKKFTERGSLRMHLRIHSEEELLSCSECGKRFTRETHLTRHMKIHTGEKPFSCSECGKRFTEKGSLTIHERIHVGEKPYCCFECGKRFTRDTHLKRHERIHTGEKPFTCSECGQRFSQETHLRRHVKIHTGEKPFGCPECGQRFTRETHLRRHVKIHTGEKPFSCSVCGKMFTRETQLRRHEKMHTKEKGCSFTECADANPWVEHLSFDDMVVGLIPRSDGLNATE
uniref:HTH CENPB-type domain-containing protein n=2 Tax=Cynoglossus semilaevis TaxID=244447 RepID=A0A3P8W7B6_CYNSE